MSTDKPMDLLRLSTAGSVDDGKSTLIGRLLYDTKSIFEDQLEAVEDASRRRGEGYVNLALLTDGLRAEREQNITIDVAYRYFATPKRKFIIADTPGHIQYTRNMVTGASTAELAVILIDARNGVLTQSKRHGFIASLLGIPHILVAVNKMDLVDWSEEVYDDICAEYTAFAEKLGVDDLTFVPISALKGDNVVDKSANMPWYDGSTLLHYLEHVNVGAHRNLVDFRFPVQYVLRPHQDYRGYAGRVASGSIRTGEEIVVLPSGRRSRIASVDTADGAVDEAVAGESVALTLDDELDISRGDMIVRPLNLPSVGQELDATICWTSEEPMKAGTQYWVRQTTREARGFISRVVYRIDVDTLHREEVEGFELNDIGRIHLTMSKPLFFDRYQLNRETGSFILIDPHSNATVAVGMLRGPVRHEVDLPAETPAAAVPRKTSPDVVWQGWNIALPEREARNGHKAAVLWLTGLSGSGKTTIASALERRLFGTGHRTMLLDGDQVRHGLNGDLGFSDADRAENIRRVGEVAALFYRQGCLVMCTFISPFREDRDRARSLVAGDRFLEVFVDTPLEECERRDPKGLYARARKGEIPHMTGISSPYEAPTSPEIRVQTVGRDVDALVDEIVEALRARAILPAQE
ncbi:MAG TPA: sulfate adenylyltransferase subunit CysN [Longimicrobiales bacterium]|nr:sulfate adenylyltransferase subunit CysN [Longimicrobiales bacterium]